MVFSYQSLRGVSCGKQPMIFSKGEKTFDVRQIQPASVDLTLSGDAFAMKSSALPGSTETIQDLLEHYQRYHISLSPGETRVFERGNCYIVPMNEQLNLSSDLYGVFSPKSSIGRCDVFVRVITDRHQGYDQTAIGYSGPLYLEVTPLSFHIEVIAGMSMTQLRLKSRQDSPMDDNEIAKLHSEFGILFDKDGRVFSNEELHLDQGLYFHVDLDRDIVGFEALSSSVNHLNLSQVNTHEVNDFWRPLHHKNGNIVLEPGKFYLLATKERVKIPPNCCGEIMPYDVNTGEFRSHYAGFFDNGFGAEHGTTGVLEVRVREVPLRIVDGQRICKMRFEKTDEIPCHLYDGNYVSANASLSKFFKDREAVWGHS